MQRREFITLIAGSTAWPLAARAQQPIPVVGYLSPRTPGEGSQSLNNFRDGLKQTGFIEGGNLTI